MPVHKAGKNCYKYGNTGKKYCGKGARKKATKQAQAIAINRKTKSK